MPRGLRRHNDPACGCKNFTCKTFCPNQEQRGCPRSHTYTGNWAYTIRCAEHNNPTPRRQSPLSRIQLSNQLVGVAACYCTSCQDSVYAFATGMVPLPPGDDIFRSNGVQETPMVAEARRYFRNKAQQVRQQFAGREDRNRPPFFLQGRRGPVSQLAAVTQSMAGFNPYTTAGPSQQRPPALAPQHRHGPSNVAAPQIPMSTGGYGFLNAVAPQIPASTGGYGSFNVALPQTPVQTGGGSSWLWRRLEPGLAVSRSPLRHQHHPRHSPQAEQRRSRSPRRHTTPDRPAQIAPSHVPSHRLPAQPRSPVVGSRHSSRPPSSAGSREGHFSDIWRGLMASRSSSRQGSREPRSREPSRR